MKEKSRKVKKKKSNKGVSKDENRGLKDKLLLETEAKLRALADYQNLQKRVEKEREELSYVLVASLLESVLEIKEDLERFSETEKSEGLKMILDKVKGIVNERNLEEMDAKKGSIFDANTMEAITTVPVKNKKEDNKVVDVLQKGYILNGEKVIKPARVVVGKLVDSQ